MAEEKWEISSKDLILFFGSVFIALFVMLGGAAGAFDPMLAGIAITLIVLFFIMGQWLEARGVFSSGFAAVWITFGLGIVMILAGLIHRGVLPLLIKTNAALLFVEITNAMIYTILILSVLAAVLAIYVFKFRKGIPLGKKKTA